MSRLIKRDTEGVKSDKELWTVREIAALCEVRRQTLDLWLRKNSLIEPKYEVMLGEKTVKLWTYDQVKQIRGEYGR